MTMKLTPDHLPILNLILMADPELAVKVEIAIKDVLKDGAPSPSFNSLITRAMDNVGSGDPVMRKAEQTALEAFGPAQPQAKVEEVPKVEETAQRIHNHLKTVGPQGPGQIKEAFPNDTSKMVTRALTRLVDSKRATWNKVKGMGSKYQATQ